MYSLTAWLLTSRPKTLWLSVSGVLVGSAAAIAEAAFDILIFVLSGITAVLLQIISNFCNDYGDVSKGTDECRVGPKRAIHLNLITLTDLKKMIVILCVVTVLCGMALLYTAIGLEKPGIFFLFVFFGGASILAAVKYTIGKKPYGYMALGDVAVFVFFGLLCVCGTYYLQTRSIGNAVILPAAALGLLSVGGLNINNMRDMKTDGEKGKQTLPLLLGHTGRIFYHTLIVALPMIFMTVFMIEKRFPPLFVIVNTSILLPLLWELRMLFGTSTPNYNQMLARRLQTVIAHAGVFFLGTVLLFTF